MTQHAKLVALRTIATKEILRFSRIWIQTILPPVITTALYFIIFGNLIGRRIGSMDGFDYMQYIAPGLIMMSVITNSYGNVVSSFFGAKFGRHIEEMLVAPMSNATIIVGHVAGGVLRGLLVGSLVTIVALFFTRLQVAHPLWLSAVAWIPIGRRWEGADKPLGTRLLGGSHQISGGRQVRFDRFFDQKMKAGPCALDADGCMGVVGSGNDHRLRIPFLKKRRDIVVVRSAITFCQ